MTGDMAGQFIFALFVVLILLPVARWFRPRHNAVPLDELRSQGLNIYLPPDSLGAVCFGGFERDRRVFERGRNTCHLWIDHDYVAVVSEGDRPSFALRRDDLEQLTWAAMGLFGTRYVRIRFQVRGGQSLERQFFVTGSTAHLFEALAEADLPLVIT